MFTKFKKLVFLGVLLAVLPGGVISPVAAQEDGVFDPRLFNWITSNVSPVTHMPLSFYISKELKLGVYEEMGSSDSLTGIIERMIVEEGISIYDAALWQMVLAHKGGFDNLKKANHLVQIYWEGHLNELVNIRAGAEWQPFVYKMDRPYAVTSDLNEKGRRGFLFRIFNAHGRYNTTDPLDGKSTMEDFPNWPTIHWEDWKPIAGENAWVVLAAMHLRARKNDSAQGGEGEQTYYKDVELKLAEEITRAALFLQAKNGGIRMAPMGTYYTRLKNAAEISLEGVERQLDDYAEKRDERQRADLNLLRILGRAYPEDFSWYYFEISTENNLSWYAALRMLYQVTDKDVYQRAMDRMEVYFQSCWNAEEKYFYQGMHEHPGRWESNTEFFASDVQNWAIGVLGPEKIDAWFGEGAAMDLWEKTKALSGYKHEGRQVQGVGYTRESDRLSVEWTAGAILASRRLKEYYKDINPEWADTAARDAVRMRQHLEEYRRDFSGQQSAYAYSSQRGWIPFGWFSHTPDVMSLASTCWVMLIDAGIDPFYL